MKNQSQLFYLLVIAAVIFGVLGLRQISNHYAESQLIATRDGIMSEDGHKKPVSLSRQEREIEKGLSSGMPLLIIGIGFALAAFWCNLRDRQEIVIPKIAGTSFSWQTPTEESILPRPRSQNQIPPTTQDDGKIDRSLFKRGFVDNQPKS
mgnify:CR=1 FL=1